YTNATARNLLRTRTGNFRGGARLARGHGDEFHPAEGVNSEGKGEQRSCGHVREEAALAGVLGRGAASQQQDSAEDDERRDDGDLDHDEPELEASVTPDAEQVGGEKERGKG